ncbi:hypothetical protein EV363DRAFT_1356446 [Boletus edulis]|nr:hypothetical protein EV363DRAFT_1356446 [Boletus edulis]
MLVPEREIVQELREIYVKKKCITKDLAKLFVKKSYRYYVLSPTLKEPICRWPDVDEDNHKTLFPPFANLGYLESHIHPQFVIFNTGQKLQDIKWRDFSAIDAFKVLDGIQLLHNAWTEVDVPADYRNLIGISKRASSKTRRSQECDTLSGDDSSSITDDTVVEDDSDWIEYIHKWQKESDSAAGKWESGELNGSYDEQLAAYIEEHARTPPSPGIWNSWKPTWGSPLRDPKIYDRPRFSSNDWAVFKNDVYLIRSEYPQVDL